VSYSLRSEESLSAGKLLKHLKGNYLSFCMKKDDMFPDVDIVVVTKFSLQELRNILSMIDDSHVMIETLNYTSDYTGDRWYK
jgi:hypothetical protein